MKKAIITMAMAGMLLIPATKVNAAEYPSAGVVVKVEEAKDVVTFATFGSGLTYTWYGAEEWATGDIVAVIMDDEGTPNFHVDDSIKVTRLCGWLW